MLLRYPERIRSFVERKLFGEHQRDLRQFDPKGINVQPEKLLRTNHHRCCRALLKLSDTERFLQSGHDPKIETRHFAEGDIQKVAAATRGVENTKFAEFAANDQQLGCTFRGVYSFPPRANNRRAHNTLNVGL